MPGPIAASVAPTASAPRATMPGGEAAPAAVQHRDATRAGEGDRQAVGDEDERRRAPARSVTWPSTSGDRRARRGEGARAAGLRVDRELGAVDLAPDRDPLGVEAERGGEPAAVLDAPRRASSLGEDAEVEAVEGRLADAAEPGREGGPGPGQLGLEPATPSLSRHSIGPCLAASSAAASSSSRPESSPSSLRRRASARPRPTAGPSVTPAAIRSSPSISSATSRQSSR